MIGRLITVALLLVSFANDAAAQDSSSREVDLCAMAAQGLLTALDGDWSLTQGIGTGQGRTGDGVITFPLPPQAPVAMTLTYDPDIGAAIMSGDGQEMLMLPVTTETAAQAFGPELEDLVGSAASGAGCDWFELPTVVGTSDYSLSGVDYTGPAAEAVGIRSNVFQFCVQGEWYAAFGLADGTFGVANTERLFVDATDWSPEAYSQLFSDLQRDPDGDPPCAVYSRRRAGDMSVTITLKFDSSSSGRGLIAFEGELDGAAFTAVAPVEMTR